MSKYGTLNYKLEELQKKLDEAKATANLFTEERGEICQIPKPFNFGGWSIPKEFQFGNRLENFYDSGTYNKFDCFNENHVKSCLEKAQNRAPQILKLAESRHQENLPAIESNKKTRENVLKFMESYGFSKTKWADSGSGRNKRRIEVQCEWVNEIKSQAEIDDGYKIFVDHINENLKKVQEEAKKYFTEIAKIKQEEERKIRESKELVESITYLKEQNISVDGLTPDGILDLAENHRREKWIAENYPDGSNMTHKCCDYCSDWTVGERRCSCGNRRMNLVVEKGRYGETGYYAYAEAY